jgi:hypothetical protein
VPSNFNLMSVKGNKIAQQSKKGLKKTPGGLLFSTNPDKIENNKYSLVGCCFQNLSELERKQTMLIRESHG